MSGYSGKDLKVSWGGTDISSLVLGPVTLSKDGVVEDTTPYGQQDQQQTYAGLRKLPDITIEGLYDDTASTGSDAVFNNVGTSKALVVTWGGSKTSTLNGIIKSYQRLAGVGKVTRFKSMIALIGPIVEA